MWQISGELGSLLPPLPCPALPCVSGRNNVEMTTLPLPPLFDGILCSFVYISEAHPQDEWCLTSSAFSPQRKPIGKDTQQHRSPADCVKAATELDAAFSLSSSSPLKVSDCLHQP